MAQQTAVEWLIEMISPYITDEKANPFIEQAKQMEKEQTIKFGKKVADHWGMTEVPQEYIEQYYNETYKK